MDNMVMAIIPREEADVVVSALIEAGYTSTILDTKGGFFRRSQKSLFIVVDDQSLDEALKIIETNCKVVLENDVESAKEDILDVSNYTKRIGSTIVFTWKLKQIINL